MHAASIFTLPLGDPLLIFLILICAVLVAPWLARRLGFPEVVGLIGVGIILGPNVLGVLEKGQALELFSTVGIMFLMFIAGLEIDENDFRRYRSKSFIFGALTFFVPMAIGTAAGLWVLRLDLIASVLLASMFASHTLVAYPIASRLRIQGDEAVGVTVGGTIITDVAALLVLAVIAGLTQGDFGPGRALQMSLSLVAFGLFMLLVLPKIAGVVLDRLEGDGDFKFLFTLAVLFFSGVLAEIAGVEPIIGAFLAGIAVGRHIPPVSPLANRLEFFGNVIFVPAFLISVGLLVDPAAFVADGTSLLTAGVMCACVIVAKLLAADISRRLFGWNSARGALMFGLSVPQAAATLAAVLVGYRLGIFGDAVLNGTIVMILVSVFVGSAAVQAAGARVAAERESGVSRGPSGRILIGVSNLDTDMRLVDVALTLRGQGELKALDVIPASAADGKTVSEATRHLAAVAERAAAAGVVMETAYRADESPARGLAAGAAEYLADTILIGWRRKRSLFDTDSKALLEETLARARPRVVALRLSSTIGTNEGVDAYFLTDASETDDFDDCVALVKALAKGSKAALRCYGPAAALEDARRVLEREPAMGEVEYIEADAHKALASPARSRRRTMRLVVCPRPGAGSRGSAARFLADADGRLKNEDIAAIFPAAAEPRAADGPRGLASLVQRLIAGPARLAGKARGRA